MSAEDYEDLGNHSTEAMGETGLFAITQVRQPVYFTNANYYFFYFYFLSTLRFITTIIIIF